MDSSTGLLRRSPDAVRAPAPITLTLIGLLVGTGGVANGASFANIAPGSSMVLKTQSIDAKDNEFGSISDRLAWIRSAFAINTSDLASAIGVDRQSIYGWTRGAAPRDNNARRINQLYELATFWIEYNKDELARGNRSFGDKREILAVLSGELGASAETRLKAIIDARNKIARRNIVELMRERNFEVPSDSQQRAELLRD